MDPTRDQHREDGVAPRDRALDDLSVVRRSRNSRDAPRELLELLHTDLAAHRDYLIASVQRVLDQVPAELA